MVAVPVHKQGGLGFRRYFERMLVALIEKGLGISLFVSGLSRIGRSSAEADVDALFFSPDGLQEKRPFFSWT